MLIRSTCIFWQYETFLKNGIIKPMYMILTPMSKTKYCHIVVFVSFHCSVPAKSVTSKFGSVLISWNMVTHILTPSTLRNGLWNQ